jgi:adenosylcobinamide kinase/adenosylcobinamide-phosphate guanylyltransferase
MRHLILGGARSGKSAYAEQHALDHSSHGQRFWYVATATASDDHEMVQRIEHHQQDRHACWQLIEEPLDVAAVIRQHATAADVVLIDCLTLWLTNALLNDTWAIVKQSFLEAVESSQAQLYFVSNEVGSGIVPLGELSRQFVDESGWLHQALAQKCEQVSLVVAGLPVELKTSATIPTAPITISHSASSTTKE